MTFLTVPIEELWFEDRHIGWGRTPQHNEALRKSLVELGWVKTGLVRAADLTPEERAVAGDSPKYKLLDGRQRFKLLSAVNAERVCSGKDAITKIPIEYLPDYVEETVLVNLYGDHKGSYLKEIGNRLPYRLDYAVVGKKIAELRGELSAQAELGRMLCISQRGLLLDVWLLVAIDFYGGPDLDYLNRCCLRTAKGEPDRENPRYIDWMWHVTSSYRDGQRAKTRLIIKNHEFISHEEFVAYFNTAFTDRAREE